MGGAVPRAGDDRPGADRRRCVGGPPRDYGVLYALSTAPDGLRITELGEDVL